jgi:hypothetical protein
MSVRAKARAFRRRRREQEARGSKNPMHHGSRWGAPQFGVRQLVAAVIDDGGPVRFLPARLAKEDSQRMRRRQQRRVSMPHCGPT